MRTSRQVARPTLRGLVVDGESSTAGGTLYPWSTLGRIMRKHGLSWWIPYDENGRELIEYGRRIRLKVEGFRPNRVAPAAQARCFRQEWRKGRLSCVERYDRCRSDAFMFLFLIALLGIMSGAMTSWVAFKVWMDFSSTQPGFEFPRLIWLMVAMLGMVSAIPLGIAFWLVSSGAVRPNVLEASFGKVGVRVWLAGGITGEWTWRAIEDIRCRAPWAVVRFADGESLRFWLRGHGRTRLVLQMIQDHLLPDISAQQKLREQRGLARAGVYVIAGSIVFGCLTFWFGHPDIAPVSRAVMGAVVALIGTLGGLGLILLGPHLTQSDSRVSLFGALFRSCRKSA